MSEPPDPRYDFGPDGPPPEHADPDLLASLKRTVGVIPDKPDTSIAGTEVARLMAKLIESVQARKGIYLLWQNERAARLAAEEALSRHKALGYPVVTRELARAREERDAAEERVAELTEALNTAPEVVQCECGKVREVWTNPLRKAAASAGRGEKT
jgi:hypothetical protein